MTSYECAAVAVLFVCIFLAIAVGMICEYKLEAKKVEMHVEMKVAKYKLDQAAKAEEVE